MTDPISDMLTQIRNALAVAKPEVVLPYSKFKHRLAEILEKQGLIDEALVITRLRQKSLKLKLKYLNGKSVMENLVRISRPGQRMYSKRDSIPRAKGGFGITIVSTSKGLLTDKEARREQLGGEVICQIW